KMWPRRRSQDRVGTAHRNRIGGQDPPYDCPMPGLIPRCQVVPLPDDQVSFEIDGRERLRWHFGSRYPRPFFYPLIGPSGAPLTRMGHPGDAGHDHHRSIWLAHNQVAGQDFWADTSKTRIRQKRWLAYQDADSEAALAVLIGW